MSDWIEGTTATIRALAKQLDAAAGYPRPPGRVVGAARPVQPSWNGQGAVPWGWSVTRLTLVRRAGGVVGLLVTPSVESIAAGADIALPPTVQRDNGTEFEGTVRIDPIADRPPRQTLAIDDAYQITWGDKTEARNARDRNR